MRAVDSEIGTVTTIAEDLVPDLDRPVVTVDVPSMWIGS